MYWMQSLSILDIKILNMDFNLLLTHGNNTTCASLFNCMPLLIVNEKASCAES